MAINKVNELRVVLRVLENAHSHSDCVCLFLFFVSLFRLVFCLAAVWRRLANAIFIV